MEIYHATSWSPPYSDRDRYGMVLVLIGHDSGTKLVGYLKSCVLQDSVATYHSFICQKMYVTTADFPF